MPIVEAKKGYDARILTFYGAFGLLLAVLAFGLGHRQLSLSSDYAEKERIQNQRRVLMPGPRGLIYDRENRVLVGNRPRFSAVLYLGELRQEFFNERRAIVRQLREAGPTTFTRKDLEGVAALGRLGVAQRYLDQVNAITGRADRVDAPKLERHFMVERLLPFPLVDDLSPTEYARLVEQLPVKGPLQVYSSSKRWYPYRTAAAHVLGRVRPDDTLPESDMAGEDLTTFNIRSTVGDSGIERQYDARLQGLPGGIIFRVDPSGFKIDPPLEKRAPVQGQNLVLSLDIDLQLAAERVMAETKGASKGGAVALEIASGEVLVLASKPTYDLNEISPTMTTATFQRIEAEGGWFNHALQGLYPPGSTYKIFTTLAGLRTGVIEPTTRLRCGGHYEVGNRLFDCHDRAVHGEIPLRVALAKSCNVYYYQVGLAAGVQGLYREASGLHLDAPTGIDLPFETRRQIIPNAEWKKEDGRGGWTLGDTANTSIGQGFVRYSPLNAVCAIASIARREKLTVPSLLHQPGRSPTGDRPREPLGISDAHYAALVDAMQAVIVVGTGKHAQVPGISIAGKTGTAQIQRKEGTANVAWFVAFAPVEKPEIAIAVAMEGDEYDAEYGGGTYSAPIVRTIIETYFDKKARVPTAPAPAINLSAVAPR